MTEIWLVRHGQTDWNLKGIYQGQSDIPLNETGVNQAMQLARSLADKGFKAIYSSDLSRARQTAEIIAREIGIPVSVDKRLREINQGEWEGKTIEYVQETYKPDFSRNPKYITTPRARGAESLAQVITRMVEAANEYQALHTDERILFSTHGLSAAALYCLVQGIALVDVVHYIPDNGQPLVVYIEHPIISPDFSSQPG